MELAEGGHAGELLPELAGGQYDASAQYGAGAEAGAAHWGGWAPGAEGSAAEEGGYSGAEAAVAPAGYGEAEPAAQYQEQYQEEYQEEQYYSSTGYSPAQYLQYLEGEVQRLSAHKAQLEQRMATAATSAYQQVQWDWGGAIGDWGLEWRAPQWCQWVWGEVDREGSLGAGVPAPGTDLSAHQLVFSSSIFFQDLGWLWPHTPCRSPPSWTPPAPACPSPRTCRP